MAYTLPGSELLQVKQTGAADSKATFVIEPLLPGFGVSIANTLRRILLSSIEGAAITSVRLAGATHEFTTLKGVREDAVSIILNLKQLKVRLEANEPTSVTLKKTGPGTVTAADFRPNALVTFSNPKHEIAHLEKDGKLELEIELAKGRGYLSTEARKDEKLPLGTIAVDSIFSPVTRVSYTIENTRVGNITNYDKITLAITTDGTITPRLALETAAKIAVEHFSIVAGLAPSEVAGPATQTEPAASPKPTTNKTRPTGEEDNS